MKYIFLLLMFPIWSVSVFSQKPVFPIHASENGRYLVDSNNKPFFYQAETPWTIFMNLNEEEMSELMDIRIRQGFNVIQTMSIATEKNVNGHEPFEDKDFTRPNLAYFEHIRKGIQLAEEKGLLVGMSTAWKGCCNSGWGEWDRFILLNGTKKCREYGRFLGKYFAGCKNLFWVQGGDNDPKAHYDHYREIALGIRESMPDVLQTYHASAGHSSSDVLPYRDNPWFNFSWTYTYSYSKRNVWFYLEGWGELPEVYEVNHLEYCKKPVKPFVLGESQYEGEDSVSYKPRTPSEMVRRQAYWSVLSGSCGHAYGSWCWGVNKDWRKVENDAGAWQMGHVRKFFEAIPWYSLVPDTENQFILEGAGTYGKTDYATAAYLPDFSLVTIYIPPTGTGSRKLTINTANIKGKIQAQWFDPVTGIYSPAVYTKKGKVLKLTTPGDHGDGGNDWVLLIKSKK